ncbi:MAG TPA: hypothetical protein VNA12_08635 [Mycobacteriales bacterium]|nr:hypothetical protein [Mycobacteriales bacterium]
MSDIETPDADVIEQAQDVTDDPPRPRTVEVPLDVNEADALEQAVPFVLDEDRD